VDLGTIQYNVEANTTDLEKANQSFDKMADSAQDAGVAVDSTSKKIDASTKSAKNNAAQMDQTGNSYRNMRGMAQNLGWQLQDVAVQLQAGTNAAVVFTQQGSQLVSAFNPLAGAFIAVAGAAAGALLPSFFKTGEAADEVRDRVVSLNNELERLNETQQSIVMLALQDEIDKQNKAIKEQTEAVNEQREEVKKLQELQSRQVFFSPVEVGDADTLATDIAKDAAEAAVALREEQTKLIALERELQKLKGEDKTVEQNIKKAKSIDDLIKSMEKQINVLSLTDEQMASYLARESGAVGIKKAYIEQLYLEIKAQEDKIAAEKKAQQLADEARRKEEQRIQSIQKLNEQMAKEAALMGSTSKEAEIRYMISNGLIQAYGAEADALIKNAQALDTARAKQKEYNDLVSQLDEQGWGDAFQSARMSDEDFNKIIEGVDNFGGAWSRTGAIIVDSMGSIIDAMDDYQLKMQEITKNEALLQKAKEESIGDPERLKQISKAETKLANDRTKANVSSYRTIAGAASEMFGKESKERKALHALEMTLATIELAMSAKKAFANAVEAVSNQGKGDPYSAFARIAAMAAIMAGLGLAVSGGGGGGGQSIAEIQASQGTGTVLGSDEKSESIISAMESMNEIGIDQLSELRGIRDSLAPVLNGIERLALGLAPRVNTQGGIVDKSGKILVREFGGQVSDVARFLMDAVSSSIDFLGVEIEKSLSSFVVDFGYISFRGMGAEEIQKELSAIFSQQADLMAEFIFPQIEKYQQMGEGAFETLTRVAREQAYFNDAIDHMGQSFGDLSAIMRIDVAQSVIDLTGGFEKFTDASSQYIDRFFSDAEKAAMLGKSLGDVFGDFSLSVPTTREEFRALVDAQDLTTESGRKLFATLLSVAESTDEYISMLEDQQDSALEILQRSVDAEKKIIADQVSILNSALNASKSVYSALDSSLKGMVISSSITMAATRAGAQAQLSGLLTGARAGVLPNIDELNSALSVISKPSEQLYSTFQEYATDFARTAASIKELKDITGEQISDEERALEELKNQSEYLDEMVGFAKDQIDAIRGVDNSVIGLSEAMINFANVIGVQLPAIRQLTPEQLSSMNTRQGEALSEKIEQVSIKQQADFKRHAEIMEASQIAISASSAAIKKIMDKFDAIGIPLREETVDAIVDPVVGAIEAAATDIVEAVTP
jgi:hypothetical protein